MWIRSQDRKALLNVNQVLISPSVDGSIYYINDSLGEESNVLGVYSTEEKALKVLNDIQEFNECTYSEMFQMPLGTYDTLKLNNEYLKRKLKEEQESHSEDVAQAKKEINDLAEKIDQYKKHILERNCRFLDVDNYSLEHYLDINSFHYGMYYKDELLKLGFTKQDMDGFIVDKYEELVKEKEEDEDD